MNKPLKVRQAQVAGDTKALAAFGRAGARATHERRLRVQTEDEMLATKRAEEEELGITEIQQFRSSTNEDIHPVD